MSNTPTLETSPSPVLLKVKRRPPQDRRQHRPEKRPRVSLHINKEGRLTATIYGYSQGLFKHPSGDLYELLDFMGQLDVWVECDGVPIAPTMILKLYCKLGPTQVRSARRNAALAAARAGAPLLT